MSVRKQLRLPLQAIEQEAVMLDDLLDKLNDARAAFTTLWNVLDHDHPALHDPTVRKVMRQIDELPKN